MVKIFNISTFKTASRCWIPVKQSQSALPRHFSQQRLVNFNNVGEASLVSNDDVFTSASKENHDEHYEPTVHSSEDFHTPGPVNKA